MAIILNIWLIN